MMFNRCYRCYHLSIPWINPKSSLTKYFIMMYCIVCDTLYHAVAGTE